MRARRILFISGSSKVNGTNWRLATAVAKLARRTLGDQAEIRTIDIGELALPPFDPTKNNQHSISEEVQRVRRDIARSDTFFVSSDEYTGMYSTEFRNFALWLSIDLDDGRNLLNGKRIVLCGASLGGLGGLRGQPALHQFLVELGAEVVSKKLNLGTSTGVFAQDGVIRPKFERQLLDEVVHELTV